MIKALLISLSFVAIIAATGRYLLVVESEYSSQLQNTSDEQLHYIHQFKNFALTQTNNLGEAQSVIHSPSTRSLVAEQKTLMDSPKVLSLIHI